MNESKEFHEFKGELKKLISNSNLDESFRRLIIFSEIYGNQESVDDSTLLNERYNRIIKEQIKGIVDDNQVNLQKNKVVNDYIIFLTNFEYIEKKKTLLKRDTTTHLNEKVQIIKKGIYEEYSDFVIKSPEININKKSIIGLIGKNGSGKTTLLSIIKKQLLTIIEEKDFFDKRRQIGFLPQNFIETGNIDTTTYLSYYLATNGIVGQENLDNVNKIILQFGLDELRHKTISSLSHGYRLRLELARVMSLKPKFLLLDEPLANLDIIMQLKLLTDLKDYTRTKSEPIIIISSHHLSVFKHYIDDCLIVNNNKVELESSILYNKYKALRIFELIITSPYSNEIKNKISSFSTVEKIDYNNYNGIIRIFVDRKCEPIYLLKELLKINLNITYFEEITSSLKNYII